ncbi:glycoside hydrolase family 3 protein [Leucobacter chromiireducens]|uniref:glycoside hydrolase family 3 protein n=1 Tax=Leucobacter chromiireducens TaxID=283877 RepID=UPI000F634C6D|nr:glycoside hydrolase family 3 N-terminal domain-containing protein [Leucobacter chromiireducens]
MSAHRDAHDPALRRAVRATLMPGFAGLTAPQWIVELLRDGLRSVCVYGQNVVDRAQLTALGHELQRAAPGALVAIDEEGGEVTRLHYRSGAPYPGAAILGRIDDAAYTEEIGRRVATDIRAAGFALALAPDADVNSTPENPVIGTRSFGATAAGAARHTAAWVRGLQAGGAIACPKHFPGHGDTTQDSHLALPTVDVDLATLRERELPPFRAAIEAGARAIMTSHILLPQIDRAAPATLSRPILQGLLREELGFTGAIVSDALDMAGASGEIGIPEAAVRALDAGCDLLCLGTATGEAGLREIEDHVLDAIAAGRLDPERVREAERRVAELCASAAPEHADTAAAPLPSGAEIDRVAASFAGLDHARAWLAAHPAARVIRVDAEANLAIGDAPWGPFASGAAELVPGAAASFGARELIRVAGSADPGWGLPAADPAGSAGLLVIGRDLHRDPEAVAGIAALRAAGFPVLTVDMGWPAAPGVAHGPAELASFGSSALAGAALLRITEGADA